MGKGGNDNGLVLLIAQEEREYFFQVGKGLEGVLNDARVGRIGRETLVPYFQRGEYGEGVVVALVQVKGLVGNDPSVVAEFEEPVGEQYLIPLAAAYFVALVGLYALGSVFGRAKVGVWIVGHVVAIVTAFVLSMSLTIIVVFLVVMFWSIATPGSGHGLGGHTGRGFGGGWPGAGGGSGRSGGFGGFGGGSFGGGGAGGKW